jgi:hypothetical protein
MGVSAATGGANALTAAIAASIYLLLSPSVDAVSRLIASAAALSTASCRVADCGESTLIGEVVPPATWDTPPQSADTAWRHTLPSKTTDKITSKSRPEITVSSVLVNTPNWLGSQAQGFGAAGFTLAR